jgi:hypothetical protein
MALAGPPASVVDVIVTVGNLSRAEVPYCDTTGAHHGLLIGDGVWESVNVEFAKGRVVHIRPPFGIRCQVPKLTSTLGLVSWALEHWFVDCVSARRCFLGCDYDHGGANSPPARRTYSSALLPNVVQLADPGKAVFIDMNDISVAVKGSKGSAEVVAQPLVLVRGVRILSAAPSLL